MAIELNQRDYQIFRCIEEHQVLLEKQISWLVSYDNQPAIIRNRLRKLFYYGYLLCHGRSNWISWSKTPTHALVYMLAPAARAVSGCADTPSELPEAEMQRHCLEVANVRMLFLRAVKDRQIRDFNWTTYKRLGDGGHTLDAQVSFKAGSQPYSFGIISQPALRPALVDQIEARLRANCSQKFLIVSRHEDDQHHVQAMLTRSSLGQRCYFSTHLELSRAGIVAPSWQSADRGTLSLFAQPAAAPVHAQAYWAPSLTVAPA